MKRIVLTLAVVALGLLTLGRPAVAATFYWDDGTVVVNGASGGGTGAWTVGAAGWENGASAQTWANNNDPVFGGTAGTVTLGGAVSTTGTVTFNTAGYIVDTGSNTATFGTLAGTGGFTKNGSGTVILSNASTASGTVQVNAGALQLLAGGALASADLTLTGGTLQLRNNNTTTFTTASTTLGAGSSTIDVNRTSGVGTGIALTMGNIVVPAGTSPLLSITGGNSYSLTLGNFSSPGAINLSFFPNTANVTVGSISQQGASGTQDLTLTGSLATGSNSVGAISATTGTWQVTKDGASTWTLNGTSTYTGVTTVKAGTLKLGQTNSINSGNNLTITGTGAGVTGTFDLAGFNQAIGQLSFGGTTTTSGAAVTNATGTGKLTVTGGASAVTYSATNNPLGATIAATQLDLNNGTQTFTVGNSTTAANDLTISSVIQNGALTKEGAGTLTLTSANSFSGATTINAGALQLTNVNALASSALNLNGGTLQLRSNVSTTFNTASTTLSASSTIDVNQDTAGSGNTLTLGNIVVPSGFSPTLNVTSANSYRLALGTISSTGGINLALNAGSTNVTVGAVAVGGGGGATFLTLDGTSTGNTIGPISNTTGTWLLNKNGSGTWNLSGANTYTGSLTIASGSILLGNPGALTGQITTDFINSTRLILNGNSVTTGNLTNPSANPIVENASNTAATLTVGSTSNLSGTFSGTLQNGTGTGALSLVKAGAGTLTLSGANSYTGGTTVRAGTLQLNNASAAGTGTIALNDASTGSNNVQLNLNPSIIDSITNAITVANQGTGTSTIKFSSTTLNGSSSTTGTWTLNKATTFDASGGFNNFYSMNHALSGSATLTISSTNNTRLSLGGSNSGFTGDIIVQNTALYEPRAGLSAITGNNITVDSGGELRIQFSNASIGGLFGAGLVRSVSSAATLSAGKGDAPGAFSGTMQNGGTTLSFTKTGTATQELSGANITYTGATSVAGGILKLTDATAFNSNVTMNGGTLQLNGTTGTWTFGNTILNGTGGGVLKTGAGTVTLSNSGSTYTGGTTISTGTLQVNANGAAGTGTIVLNDTNTGSSNVQLSINDLALANDVTVSNNGTGTDTISYLPASSGLFTLNLGNVTLNKATTFNAPNLNSGGATLQFMNSTKALSGSGALTVGSTNGQRMLLNASAATYTGNITIQNNAVLEPRSQLSGATGNSVQVDNGGILQIVFSDTSINALTGSGTVRGNGFDVGTRTLTVGKAGGGGDFSGVIQNNGTTIALTKTGGGTQTLSGTSANTYSGLTTVSGGTLELGKTANVTAIGGNLSLSAGTVKYTGASNNEIIDTGTVSINGASAVLDLGTNHSDTVATVTLDGGGSITGTGTSALTVNSANTFEMKSGSASAILAGTAALNKTTGGTVALSGANTYSGNTTITAGTLKIGAGVGVIPDGAGKGNVSLAGTLDLNGNSETINGLSGAGTVTSSVSGAVTLTAGDNNQTSTFDGVIQNGSGIVALTKTGSGALTLSGTSVNTYTGATNVTAGTLVVNGSIASSTLTTIDSGATLKGTGTIGNLLVNGFHKPGNSPGVQPIAGNYSLPGDLEIEFLGSSYVAGTGYDQLQVSGNVTLNSSATLSTPYSGSGFDPAFGTVFTLIDNQGSNPVSGIFSGMAAGFGFTINGKQVKIYYDGNDGNDIVLVSNNYTTTPVTLYVDSSFVMPPAVVDGDSQQAGQQTAYVGSSAFASPTAALSALGTLSPANPTANLILNGGTYNSVLLAGGGAVELDLVGTGGNPDVTIQNLSGDTGDSIVTQFHNVATFGDLTVESGTFAGVISGGGTVTKTTSGTLVLTGLNTYTGKTTIANGTVSINNVNAPATAAQSLGQNTDVDLGVAATSSGRLLYTGVAGTLAKNINVLGNGSNTIENAGSGLLTLTGTITKNGTTLILKGGAGGILVSGTGTITGAGANSDLVVDGGPVTLATANTYNGPTFIINGGSLTASAANALPTSPDRSALIMDQTGSGSSSLVLGASQFIQSLTGAGTSTVNLNANTLTIGTTSGSTAFAGIISGAGGSLVKDGASTQVLTGPNTYSGSTTVSAGTLHLTGGGLENSNISVTGGTFRQTAGTNNVTGTSAVDATPSGNLTITGSGQYRLQGGTLNFGDYGAVGSTTWNPADVSSITTPTGAQFEFSGGSLLDVRSIVVGDSSAFTQSGGNFYVGQDDIGPAALTTINGGYSLLAGTLHLDVFGADPTPEACCDGVAGLNDQLTITGDAVLDSLIDLDFIGHTPVLGETFTLLCADHIVLDDGFGLSDGFFRVVPTGLGPGFPQFALQAIVPEPASVAVWTLAGLAGAAGAWRCRGRQRKSEG